jgi:prepilin-type N-terminal cleavage/methylation domain-containing protein
MMHHTARRAFTLIELLVVVAIIMVLIAILIPAVNLVQNKAHAASSLTQVQSLAVAMRAYADEDPRHCFPTPKAGSEFLIYDLTDANCTLMLLERSGYQVTSSDVDAAGGTHCLMDGWWRPLHYKLDGPFMSGGTLNSAAMNGTADKPATLDDWNPKNVEPFTYLWSLGKPHSSDANDALATNSSS